jgi:hypothetical protein
LLKHRGPLEAGVDMSRAVGMEKLIVAAWGRDASSGGEMTRWWLSGQHDVWFESPED